MSNGLIETAAQTEAPEAHRLYGVAVGTVVNNVDLAGLGRVQVRLGWLGMTPWARVALPMAGMGRGTYFIPMIGDEVLVAFTHGDVREPVIIGSMWNGLDRPPNPLPFESLYKRTIRTPFGHELEFNDLFQSIEITTSTKQKIIMDPLQIKISTTAGLPSITMDTFGQITIEGGISLELKALDIQIEGGASVNISAPDVKIGGGTICNMRADLVTIN